jgi:hypothetical protein
MNKEDDMEDKNVHRCAECPMRKKTEENPNAFMSKLWKWHTKWCPGWKAYQKSLEEK